MVRFADRRRKFSVDIRNPIEAGKLGTDLNRDTLAAALAVEGVQPVRQVAIDETWSALRFRPA